ncbi:nitrogen fixation negative regulator NifL [Vibrio hippocampi]|uniref:histidine kinase n=1 Tax=Vibrio hippocampi TaxID=654686 RepID=A0ABM8ZLN0_9VIBR|nr:nitrogen fixation negative regulator NifL [Vibrio hippocampi]CAH0529337.1 Nitrogen fixation regulatory protein [Vibrio hippocampi]
MEPRTTEANKYQELGLPSQKLMHTEAYLLTDSRGEILYANHQLQTLTGYNEKELVGKNCSLFSNQFTPRAIYQELWDTISQGYSWRGHLVNRKKSGELYITELSITPEFDGQNQRYHAIHRDVSEQFSLQQSSRNHQSLFESVLNLASISSVILDANQKIAFTNKGMKQTIGEDYFQDYLYPQLLIDIRQQGGRLDRLFKREIEVFFRGELRHFEYSLEPVQWQAGSNDTFFHPQIQQYLVVVINERTREKRLMEQKRIDALKLVAYESKHVHSMQEVLMATIHQLQAPLNMIDSAVNILRSRNHACAGLSMMKDAVTEGFDALKFIQNAIPERAPESMQATNVNQVISDACSISSSRLLHEYIECELQLSPCLPTINAMPERLRLALVQLIDNAIESIVLSKPRDRGLILRSDYYEQELFITIEDSGNGISTDLHNKVFEPFYSSKSPCHSDCRGMGLAIVQQVVNDHQGIINIDTSDNLGGAKLSLILPVNLWGVEQ